MGEGDPLRGSGACIPGSHRSSRQHLPCLKAGVTPCLNGCTCEQPDHARSTTSQNVEQHCALQEHEQPQSSSELTWEGEAALRTTVWWLVMLSLVPRVEMEAKSRLDPPARGGIPASPWA